MSYKPDEKILMAYLYDELPVEEKLMVEKYLQENPQALKEFQDLQSLRKFLSTVEDKEVIAPPIVVESSNQRFFWNAPYFKTITSIAASLLILMLVGKLTELQMNYGNNELRLSFGAPVVSQDQNNPMLASVTKEEIQQMINVSMQDNNNVMLANWSEAQQKQLDESIRKNLAVNSTKINSLVQQASRASQDEIQRYVAGLQNQNHEMVKNYFQLTASEQQKYIEGLLVDFAKYMNQQRVNDLTTLQARLSGIEQNTTVFKQETEQILASIISNTSTPASASKSY
jgi:GTPase SAR1 family protein